ncbi:Regulation of nuclear pre-mRNA domain-containing protein 1A [Gurleya vavrai]
MSCLVPEFLIRSLQTLSNNKEELQTLALFIYSNKSDSPLIITILNNEFDKSNYNHKFTLLSLSCEILEITEDEESELIFEVKKMIPKFFKIIIASNDLFFKTKLLRLEKYLIEKNFFDECDFDSVFCKTSKIDENYKFTREEMITKINDFFDKKEELVKYLKEFVKRNE